MRWSLADTFEIVLLVIILFVALQIRSKLPTTITHILKFEPSAREEPPTATPEAINFDSPRQSISDTLSEIYNEEPTHYAEKEKVSRH